MKENMGFHKGVKQGDMSPDVEDYQKPLGDYAETGFSKTTQYIERQDKFQKKEANEIKSQHYQGRYS